MKRKVLLIIFCGILGLFFVGTDAFAVDKIIAYPVPFNPHQQTLTVNYQTGGNLSRRIMFEVFDINGDRVFSRDYYSFPIKWGGYTTGGSRIKPGMYILKVTSEDSSAGVNDVQIVRILVRY